MQSLIGQIVENLSPVGFNIFDHICFYVLFDKESNTQEARWLGTLRQFLSCAQMGGMKWLNGHIC